jgi:hypothetical protein
MRLAYHKMTLMTRKERIDQYEEIRKSILENPYVKEAVSDKNNELTNLKKGQYQSFQTPSPQPSPPGSPPDEGFKKSQTQSDKDFRQKYQALEAKHDQKIHDMIKQDLENRGEYDKFKTIDDLGPDKTGTLLEKDGAKDLVDLEDKQKQLSPSKETDPQLDQRKVERQTKEFDQNKQEIIQDYRLDDREMEALLNDGRGYDLGLDDKDKSKNKDIDKSNDKSPDKPDPSDEFE